MALQFFHFQFERCDNAGIQAHSGVIAAKLLDSGRQLDFFLVDLGVSQLGQQFSDFFAGDLAIQLAGGTALDFGGDDLALDLCSQLFGSRAGFCLMVEKYVRNN